MSRWFGGGGRTAGCRETCYSTAWQPLNSAVMWGRTFTTSAEAMPETLSVTGPPVTKALKGCGARSCFLIPLFSLVLWVQAHPPVPTCRVGLLLSSPFPQPSQDKELLQGLQLLLTCPWPVLPRDSTMSCPSCLVFHSVPFIPGRAGTSRKAVFRGSSKTDALNKLQTCPQSPLQQSLNHSFRGRYRQSSRGRALVLLLALPRREIQAVINH